MERSCARMESRGVWKDTLTRCPPLSVVRADEAAERTCCGLQFIWPGVKCSVAPQQRADRFVSFASATFVRARRRARLSVARQTPISQSINQMGGRAKWNGAGRKLRRPFIWARRPH